MRERADTRPTAPCLSMAAGACPACLVVALMPDGSVLWPDRKISPLREAIQYRRFACAFTIKSAPDRVVRPAWNRTKAEPRCPPGVRLKTPDAGLMVPVTYRPASGQGRRTPIVDTPACRQADGASRTARPLGNSQAALTTASVPQQMLYADWNSVRLPPSPSHQRAGLDTGYSVRVHHQDKTFHAGFCAELLSPNRYLLVAAARMRVLPRRR